MQTNTEHADWGAALLVLLIVVVMLFSKSTRYEEAEETSAVEMTGSITR
jgi:hypothetical protein